MKPSGLSKGKTIKHQVWLKSNTSL